MTTRFQWVKFIFSTMRVFQYHLAVLKHIIRFGDFGACIWNLELCLAILHYFTRVKYIPQPLYNHRGIDIRVRNQYKQFILDNKIHKYLQICKAEERPQEDTKIAQNGMRLRVHCQRSSRRQKEFATGLYCKWRFERNGSSEEKEESKNGHTEKERKGNYDLGRATGAEGDAWFLWKGLHRGDIQW